MSAPTFVFNVRNRQHNGEIFCLLRQIFSTCVICWWFRLCLYTLFYCLTTSVLFVVNFAEGISRQAGTQRSPSQWQYPVQWHPFD